MTEISQELAQRMAVLVRDLRADHVKHGSYDIVQDFVARTAAIVAELPVPVDPDLVAARLMCSEMFPTASANFVDGLADGGSAVQWTLAGIKRGRELERQSPPTDTGENL